MFIALAPMEGVVDSVMRELLTQIGGIDQCTTEFIRVTQREFPDRVFFRYCPELKTGGKTISGVPVYIQLLGGHPELLALNAFRAQQLGALGIDLNFGCPAKTVNRHDGGATLLKTPHRLYDIISTVRKMVPAPCPVTAKVRLGFSDKSLATEIAQAVDQAKASSLTVHARTRLEAYKPPAHWESIGLMREAVKIPVIANGDIWSVEDYRKCLKASGCKNIALGRPLIAFPDLGRILKSWETGHPLPPLNWTQILQDWFKKFLFQCEKLRGEHFSLNRSKQWLKLLGRQYPSAKTLFEQAKTATNLDEFRQHLSST